MLDYDASALVELFKICSRGLYLAGEWVKKTNDKYDFIGTCAKKYLDALTTRYGTVKIMGMQDPVDLLKLYTRVAVLEKPASWNRYTLDFLETSFDLKKRRFYSNLQIKDAEIVLNDLDKFMLLGKPGAGKSTFMKFTAISSAQGKLKEQRIPILVNLKDFSDSNIELTAYIEKQFDICKFPNAKQFVENGLRDGKMLLLLDGLDEISDSKKNAIIGEICDFTDKYDRNKFIISCRVAYYNSYFEKFSDVEIADFNTEQIYSFINNWFGGNREVAEKCFTAIRDRPQLSELSSTPLLLTLLCITYEATLSIPESRSELYKEAVDALLKKWDASRNIERGSIYKNLSIRRKEGLFSQVAFNSFVNGEYFFKERTLVKYVEEYLEHLVLKRDCNELDTERIIKSIECQHGIFVERSKGIYSFSHLTFQEYFAAKFIAETYAEPQIKAIINKYLFNRRWREIFLLLPELLPQADVFIETVTKTPQILEDSAGKVLLVELVQDIEGISPVDGENLYLARVENLIATLRTTLFINETLEEAMSTIQQRNYDATSYDHDQITFCMEMNDDILNNISRGCKNLIGTLQVLIEATRPVATLFPTLICEELGNKDEQYYPMISSICDDFEDVLASSNPYTDSYGAVELYSIVSTHLSYHLKSSTVSNMLPSCDVLRVAEKICTSEVYCGFEECIKPFEDYLHANEVVILATQGDSVVSKTTRKSMLDSILTVKQLVTQ